MSFPKEFELADTFFKRARGLMFRRKIEKPLLFILPTESRELSSIHSLFVFFPFDAVFLNSKGVVVDVRRVKPFTLNVTPKKPAKYIIEMEAGEAERRGIGVGDRLPSRHIFKT
ncbi:MAG: DUF192 domain-containing protein [Candidatus Micrarchaeia archaeon]